jgi:tetratricopeptide (TPR) repeat protein
LTRFQRQSQAETRRLLEILGSTYKAVLAGLTSVRDATRRLGQEAAASSPVIERLHHEFPTVRDRGFDAMKVIPLTRGRVVSLQEEMERELSHLEEQQRTLDQLASLLRAGEQALNEGRYAAGARIFEQILTALPESIAARTRLAECRTFLETQRADAQRVKSLVREAQAHARSEEWERVLVVCEEILGIDRTVPMAIALHEAARIAVEKERQRAAELRLDHAIRQIVDAARASFNRGRCDEALQALRAFLSEHPAAADVQMELNRLTALATQRDGEAAARATEIQQRTVAARAMLEAESFDEAIVEARCAVECDPADASAVSLLCEAIERESVARIAAQRDSAAYLALEAARRALKDGELLRAVAAAENAVRLSPSLSIANRLLELARATLASDAPDDRFKDDEAARHTSVR